jgi:hypothetical protein
MHASRRLKIFVRGLRVQLEALWKVHEAWAESVMIGPREWVATWGEIAKSRPPMPEPLKPVSIAPPDDMPKIRPLPSAQPPTKDKENE